MQYGNKKKGLVECFNKYLAACCDEGGVACLDKNNKYYFDVDFILLHPLE